MCQHVTEHAGETKRHRFRASGIPDDQVRNRIQGVEQKVRIDLRPQRAKLGLGHLLQQERLATLALDRLPLAAERIQAIAKLRGDRAQVDQVIHHETRAICPRRDQQDMSDSSSGGDRDQDLGIRQWKEPPQWIGVIQLDDLCFKNARGPLHRRYVVQ